MKNAIIVVNDVQASREKLMRLYQKIPAPKTMEESLQLAHDFKDVDDGLMRGIAGCGFIHSLIIYIPKDIQK